MTLNLLPTGRSWASASRPSETGDPLIDDLGHLDADDVRVVERDVACRGLPEAADQLGGLHVPPVQYLHRDRPGADPIPRLEDRAQPAGPELPLDDEAEEGRRGDGLRVRRQLCQERLGLPRLLRHQTAEDVLVRGVIQQRRRPGDAAQARREVATTHRRKVVAGEGKQIIICT